MIPNRSTATAEAMYSLDSDCTNWSVIGETVQWHGSADSKPTDAEIKAEIDRLDAEYDSQEYSRARANEYPDYRDFLDAVVKGDDTQKQKYIDDCLAVKAKYKKG